MREFRKKNSYYITHWNGKKLKNVSRSIKLTFCFKYLDGIFKLRKKLNIKFLSSWSTLYKAPIFYSPLCAAYKNNFQLQITSRINHEGNIICIVPKRFAKIVYWAKGLPTFTELTKRSVIRTLFMLHSLLSSVISCVRKETHSVQIFAAKQHQPELISCKWHKSLVFYHRITRNTRKYSAREFCNHLNIDHLAIHAHIRSAFCTHQLNTSFVPEKKRVTCSKSRRDLAGTNWSVAAVIWKGPLKTWTPGWISWPSSHKSEGGEPLMMYQG